MSNWNNFLYLDEQKQSEFLLKVASNAWFQCEVGDDYFYKVKHYLVLADKLLSGDVGVFSKLLIFIEAPDHEECFVDYYYLVKGNEKYEAALDLAVYACAFILRVVAGRNNFSRLPDPVLEALPDVYEYFEEKDKLFS